MAKPFASAHHDGDTLRCPESTGRAEPSATVITARHAIAGVTLVAIVAGVMTLGTIAIAWFIAEVFN